MNIQLVHVSRRPFWPIWAVLLVLLWAGLGLAVISLSRHTGHPVQLCLFKKLTGIPCPTCGLTRGALSLLNGQFSPWWRLNPLMAVVITFFFILIAMRVFFARGIRLHLTPAQRHIAWLLTGTLLLLNWAYVIAFTG